MTHRYDERIREEARRHYCDSLRTWARLMSEQEQEFDESPIADAIKTIELAVEKSCLLDRMIYGGEHASQTPCPVHKGRWSGCHFLWPGQAWIDPKTGGKTPVEPEPMLKAWYEQGCRCFQHSCGCTTGWQPDEHCGCGVPKE